MAVTVVSSLALKGVLEGLRPPSAEMRFDATQAILAELERGLRADLLILTAEAMDELAKRGKVKDARILGASGVGVAVRAGARRPDIGTVDALKRSLEAASSVAHSKVGASGIYFAALLEKLNIQLKKRVVVEKGPVGAVVAAGDAEIGVQQLCELAPVPGIDIVGPLPHAVQKLTRFSAGIPAGAANASGARALLELLRSDAARAAMAKGGLEPAVPA
jgi:molybdate transport system substrate-binding protein